MTRSVQRDFDPRVNRAVAESYTFRYTCTDEGLFIVAISYGVYMCEHVCVRSRSQPQISGC